MADDEDKKATLSFMIGQVQTFIEAARTVRDLWTGSYLMSWLTAAAMKPIVEAEGCGYGAFVTPKVDADNPMLAAIMGRTGKGDRTLPCLPNKFSAEVPLARAKDLREASLKACEEEWVRICGAVHGKLDDIFPSGESRWDRDWKEQLAACLEVRCVVRELADVPADSCEWVEEWGRLGELMEMTRSVKHVPDYRPAPGDRGRFPVKCSLLGTYEQMGPADLGEAKEFWEGVATPKWKGLHGTRLQSNDKLCAVSLVKRFAWPAYFSGKLGLDSRELRYSDSATLAAKRWLNQGERLDPDRIWREEGEWSGLWLHWPGPTNDDGETCPPGVWKKIQAKKAAQGNPPTYFALLLLDGDRMGDLFRGDIGKRIPGEGRSRYRAITGRLTAFSLSVGTTVEKHCGELIYAGGDDVMAFLPTETALACAREIRDAFRDEDCLTSDSSISGGLAVVHYKEDLRFALQQVRAAEKAAKSIGKRSGKGDPKEKDALALTVCRRSGEHSTAVLGWEQVPDLAELVKAFVGKDGASDRWTYKLRADLHTLAAMPPAAVTSEVGRLLDRVESPPKGFVDRVKALLQGYRDEMQKPKRAWKDDDVLEGFVALCQSASFLARGRD